ncbi:MAG: hypothetical protein ACC656_13155, partial [Candidatus Heimdallarchaeota archaeon]
VWILDTNLTIVYSWDYALVGKSDFSNKLSAVIGGITSEVTSEITVTSGDTTFTTTTVSTTVIDNPVSKVDEEVQTFGLFENPLFVGFLFLTGIGIVYVVFTRRG